MRSAFLILGGFDPWQDRAEICDGEARMVGVSTLEQACQVARELQAQGVGCIELCGAFGEAGAQAVIRATGNQIPIGYVTHLPQQDSLYQKVFPAGLMPGTRQSAAAKAAAALFLSGKC